MERSGGTRTSGKAGKKRGELSRSRIDLREVHTRRCSDRYEITLGMMFSDNLVLSILYYDIIVGEIVLWLLDLLVMAGDFLVLVYGIITHDECGDRKLTIMDTPRSDLTADYHLWLYYGLLTPLRRVPR